MNALHALRALRESSAAHLSAATGLPLEDVYQTLIEAQSAGSVSLRQTYSHRGRAVFTWVAL